MEIMSHTMGSKIKAEQSSVVLGRYLLLQRCRKRHAPPHTAPKYRGKKKTPHERPFLPRFLEDKEGVRRGANYQLLVWDGAPPFSRYVQHFV